MQDESLNAEFYTVNQVQNQFNMYSIDSCYEDWTIENNNMECGTSCAPLERNVSKATTEASLMNNNSHD